MDSKDIKKLHEVTSKMTREVSLKMIREREEIIAAKMEKIRQEEIRQAQLELDELAEEEGRDSDMILQ